MPAESVHPEAEIQASTSFNSLPHSIPKLQVTYIFVQPFLNNFLTLYIDLTYGFSILGK
ncbi:hypothetical protein GCM10011384_31830 [Psychrobacillus lasiicapitis]|nr:hypothetical protein GCM10011384_31830 [Psychrobacillus lasiicapitis]